MVIANSERFILNLPVLLKCDSEPCKKYLILLQNDYTKELWLFKVIDWSRIPKLRICIDFKIPACFDSGTYTYYLLRETEWDVNDLNVDDPHKSASYTDKGAITGNGMYFIYKDKMLVTNKFKAAFYTQEDINKKVTDKGALIKGSFQSVKDNDGLIVKSLHITQTGLFKYNVKDKIVCCNEPELKVTYNQFKY